MKNRSLCISLVIIAAFLVSARWASRADDAPAEPTVEASDTTLAVSLSVGDMVNQSDVIAIGNCIETQSVWVDKSLVTLATVAVNETLKGVSAQPPLVGLNTAGPIFGLSFLSNDAGLTFTRINNLNFRFSLIMSEIPPTE